MTAPNWTLVRRKLKDLKPHPKNPRSLSTDDGTHLQISLEKFGIADKPIINQDGMIIGGHQRVKILKKMGIKEIECLVPDRLLDQREVDEFNIRLNRNTGEWDWEILANEWEPTDLLEWGFRAEEMLGEMPEQVEGEAEEDGEVLEPGKDEDAITNLGDVYELNDHRLVCGDSTMPDVVAKCLNGQEPILMCTDPPYGVNYDASWREPEKIGEGKSQKRSVKSKGKVLNDDKVNWALAWHLFPGSIAYVWHSGNSCSDVQKSLEEAEFYIVSQIIWTKEKFALSRGDYHWQHEPCWYAIRKGRGHNWQGSRKEKTVWEIRNAHGYIKLKDGDESTGHSTQKPIECMARPIRNNTHIGEGVYDPFLGSGTTLIAAEQLSRTCYGIELSPPYCDIVVNRWAKWMTKNNKEFTIKKNGQPFLFPRSMGKSV
jgi:DNA modification methylase